MKKLIFVFVNLALILFATTSCEKKTKQAPPQAAPSPTQPADSLEIKSIQEIALATALVCDVDLIIGMPADNELMSLIYCHAPINNTSPRVSLRDMTSNYVSVSFSNTSCTDAKVRNGELKMFGGYDATKNPGSTNVKDYAEFGYCGYILFNNFSVDGWKIDNFDASKPLVVSNKLSSASYNPEQENITWRTAGKLVLTRPDGKQLIWDGFLLKELLNTSDSTIFEKDDVVKPIQWGRSKLQYTGSFTGTTPAGGNYSCALNQMVRDFNCTFPPVPVHPGQDTPHFTHGKLNYTNSNFNPMEFNFGPTQICDGGGVVTVNAKSYQVKLQK
jgi:hypothetical protein